MEEKIRIGKYLRVSSRESAMFGYGLGAQADKINAYLQLFDYDEEGAIEYVDEGISAKDTNRKELKRLLEDVKSGKINLIIIYKLDRLARNVIDTYEIISVLMEHKCNLIAVMDQLDIHSANGRMLVGILSIIAQWEREVIVERTLDGMAAMVSRGKYPYGKVPFGWNRNDNQFLSVNKKESYIINHLAELYMDGNSLNELKRVLMDEFGITRKSDSIKKWFRRDYNVGEFLYHGHVYRDIIPAIMQKDKYKRLQKLLAKRTTRWSTQEYYFANLVYCSCGELADQTASNKKNKKYRYYECSKCLKRINQDYIINQRIDEIIREHSTQKMSEAKSMVIKRSKKINEKIDHLYSQYVSNVLNEKVYAVTIYKLQKDKEALLENLDGLSIDNRLKWNKKSDASKKRFIQTSVAKVVVDMDLKLVLKVGYKEKC